MNLVCEKLKNNNGLEVTLLNLGATITSVSVPVADDGRIDLTLGYDKPEDYFDDRFHFGSTPGRYANRIGCGRFSLNGMDYQLTCNDGKHQLHGGETDFAKKLWDCSREADLVTFTYTSPDGENGYPGMLTAHIAYSLNDEGELTIDYCAVSDADTIINLTNHAYFNLSDGSGPVFDHELELNSDSFIVTDKESIPTGEIRTTADSPMDFSKAKKIGSVIHSDYDQISNFNGLDSCFVVNGSGLRRAAVLTDPASGRSLEVDTDMPGIQIYSGQGIKEGTEGRDGRVYGPCSGLCLEAQDYPDAPNHPEFPSAILRKGEVYKRTIIYRFKY